MKEQWENFKETLDDTKMMSKKEFLLMMAVCILGGIVFGMLFSPRKCTTVGCYNGNNTGRNSKDKEAAGKKEADEILDWED